MFTLGNPSVLYCETCGGIDNSHPTSIWTLQGWQLLVGVHLDKVP